MSDSPSSWGCWDCDHGTFVWPTDGWKCSRCNSREYYQVDRVVRRETEEGVWMFTPHVQSRDHSHRLHEPHPAIPSPPSDHRAYGEGSEQAESEVRTIDPIVEPQDESTSRRRNRGRRARRTTAHEDAIRTPAQSQLSHVLQTLQNALANNHENSHPSREASSNSSRTWNSRMGPEPGVRFRGGAPPPRPQWRYNKEDLRSFLKWQRKLSVWKLQSQSCMTLREASLFPYTSLSGEAEEEQEHADLL